MNGQQEQEQQQQQRRGEPRVINSPETMEWEQELLELERAPWASRRGSVLDDPLSFADDPAPLGCCECTGHDITFDSARPFVTGRSAERLQRMARMATAGPQTTARQPMQNAADRTAMLERAQKRLMVKADRTMASPAVSPSSTPEMAYKKRARTPWDDGAPVASRPRSPNSAVWTNVHE